MGTRDYVKGILAVIYYANINLDAPESGGWSYRQIFTMRLDIAIKLWQQACTFCENQINVHYAFNNLAEVPAYRQAGRRYSFSGKATPLYEQFIAIVRFLYVSS